MSETIHRLKNKTGNFTIVLNEVFRRSDLSARAKGIYAYIMTLPDDWFLCKQELYTHFAEGKAALDTGFKELETAGYINKRLLRNEYGHITATEYTVYESAIMNDSPKSENRKTVKPDPNSPFSDLPLSVYPLSDNRTLLKTDSTKDLVEPITENIYKKSIGGSSSNQAALKKNQTTTTNNNILNFQKECEYLGFPITESRARSLIQKGLNPEWLTGPCSFPAAIAAYVNGSYSEKAPDERLKLFLRALEWEDRREEYQDFQKRQKTEAGENRQEAETEAERQRKETRRRVTPRPTVCGNCGAAIPADTEVCQKCDHYVVWDDEQEKFVFQKRFDFSDFAKAFRKKHRIGNDEIGDGDISQYFREA